MATYTENEKVIQADAGIQRTAELPKDFARHTITQWVALRSLEPNLTNGEAAAKLGVNRHTLGGYIAKATREGWLKFDDPLSKLEYQIIPKVVDNLNRFLDEGDKTVTIETAKATIYKQYMESKGISEAPSTILALKIEPAEGEMRVVTGTIVGKPRQLSE